MLIVKPAPLGTNESQESAQQVLQALANQQRQSSQEQQPSNQRQPATLRRKERKPTDNVLLFDNLKDEQISLSDDCKTVSRKK